MAKRDPGPTQEEYTELARWVRQDFDPSTLRVRPGRPSISDIPGTHSPRMATRVSPRVKQLFAEKAATEGENPSRVMRRLVEEYVGVQSSGRATRRPRRPSRGSAA
jgi:hypothetical protein